MPVNTPYDGYKKVVDKIKQVRTFGDGDIAVKDSGEKYLPKLSGQSVDDYDKYKSRGLVIPVVSPTAAAIRGAIMRKESMYTGGLPYLLDNFDGNSTNINQFTGCMIDELLYAGGAGYLVEYDEKDAQWYVKQYTRENIINVTDEFIVLAQQYTKQDDKDKFKTHTLTEYLELTFDDGGYIQNLWREKGERWVIVETLAPTSRGERLNYLPFVKSVIKGTDDPLLLHLSNVNCDQYRLSTDLRHGLHWTALPTLFLFGDLKDADGNSKQIKVGAGSANHIEDVEAKAELLEFTGAGLGAIKSAIDDDISVMASIGAKMLQDNSQGVKAAETARIESSSETATLSTIANTVDNTMEQILFIISEWSGTALAEYKVNRDFIDIKLDPAALMALLKTWQSGGMSLDSFLYQLEKGELLPPDIDAAKEAGRIETTGNDFEVDLDD